MRFAYRRAARSAISAVRQWPLWELHGWLLAFVLAVPAADLIALAATAAVTPVRGHDLEIFAILLACNAATVELTRGPGEPIGLVRDVNAVWQICRWPSCCLPSTPSWCLFPGWLWPNGAFAER
jgi:hypothetical protein